MLQKIEDFASGMEKARESLLKTGEYGCGLSKRELEVARLVVKRRSRKEIAEELFISEHTVKNYVTRIFDKLGLTGTPKQKQKQLAGLLDGEVDE